MTGYGGELMALCPDPNCRCAEHSPDTWSGWKARRFFQALGFVGSVGTYQAMVSAEEQERLERWKREHQEPEA